MSGASHDETDTGNPILPPVAPPKSGSRFLIRGDTVGRYVVLSRIGSGGMGIVYAAYDPQLDRKVALKLLHPERRRRTEVAQARLAREAQALARVNHPGVVAVHDVGTFAGQIFIAMEFIDGVDLTTWSTAQPRTWQEILAVLCSAGEGLAAAHAAGLVHRDFKPDNILIATDGRVRVLDFGLASSDPSAAALHNDDAPLGVGPSDSTRASTIGSPSPHLTQAGSVIGTPAYMAPEQHLGEAADARCDQFSFCVTCYEALMGQRPYAGNTSAAIAYHVLQGHIQEPPKDHPPIPAWLRRALVRGLSRDPAGRWPSMNELLQALAASPTARQRRTALAVIGVGLAGAAALALAAMDPSSAVCRAAERKLAGTWDEPTRIAVAQAFAASDRPYAKDALTSTRDTLDDYAARFVSLHTSICEATAVHHEQSQDQLDLKVACLDRRLKELHALTTLLRRGDESTVSQAVTAAATLSPLEPCQEHQTPQEPSKHRSPAQQAASLAIEDELTAGAQQLRLAHFDDALATAKRAADQATAADDDGLIAQTLVLLGRSELQMGQPRQAEIHLREATWRADQAADDRTRSDAYKDLLWVVGLDTTQTTQVEQIAQAALSALARVGGDPLLEADLHNNLGVIARRRGDSRRAVAEHERALELRRANVDGRDPRIADSLLNLGSALADAGKFDRAQTALSEAVDIVRQRYGESHPRYASVLHAQAIVVHRRGDSMAASKLLLQATEIRAHALPPQHPDLANSEHDLGAILLAGGRPVDAAEHFRKAVELRRAQGHGGSLANSLTGLGQALLAQQQPQAAQTYLAQALALRDHPEIDAALRAETEFAYAQALWPQDPGRAGSLAHQALARLAALDLPDRPQPEDPERDAQRAKVTAWLGDHPTDRGPSPPTQEGPKPPRP